MRKTNKGYYVNRHSCFLLQYHLVLVTKYRHPVLIDDLETALCTYTKEYFKNHGFAIKEMNCNKDHVHILFEAPPQVNLSQFINAYKSASSRKMRKNFSKFLASYYWKPYFWSLSYFIGTVSEQTTSVVQNYIRNQKQ